MELSLIQNKIHEIRGQRVILDFDLAEMYQVATKAFKQSVKRNMKRFPDDFMFELTKQEWKELVTNCDHIPETMKYSYIPPFAFTEHGVTMLSGVLHSETAINASIQVVRAFIAMRNIMVAAKENNLLPGLISRIKTLEEISEETLAAINDLSEDTRKEFDEIYIAMTELSDRHKALNKPRPRIGFVKPDTNTE